MKQSNSACALLTVLVLVLAGREIQRTFFTDTDDSSGALAQDITAAELAEFFNIDAWSFTLPQVITTERAKVVLNWYRLDEWRDEEGELIGHDCSFYINEYDAGKGIRLLIKDPEPGTDLFEVGFRGPSMWARNGTFNPYTDRENVGRSTHYSAGWDENLITFSSNPKAESGQAPEYWALRASFEEITPEEEAELLKMIEDSQKDN